MTNKIKKTILVIDDDEVLRELMERMLVRMDYNVLTASSGDEAVKLGGADDVRIDAAIIDLFLPDVRGDKLSPELQATHPDMKTILMSGYELQDKAVLNINASGFIQKPCGYQDLEEVLTTVFSDE